MRLRHPRRSALQRWLQGEADPTVERHVASCEHCAERLEALDVAPGGAARPDGHVLRRALEASLAPPPDLAGRLTLSVDERQRKISFSGIFIDAVGGGVDTLRLLISEDPNDG